MSFILDVIRRAKENIKTIVLPESTDLRILKAVDIILKEKFCKIILIGNKEEILTLAKENNLNVAKAEIVDPTNFENYLKFVNDFYELRKHKGITIEEAKKFMLNPLYFATMMVKEEQADGIVAGATYTTADSLRAPLQILRVAPGVKLVSTFVVMEIPNCEYGENGLLVFSDGALNEKPNSEELAEIAILTSKNFKQIIGKEPKVAMLSYSTKGSAKGEEVDRVRIATELVRERVPDLLVDGELQFDSAIIPSVAKFKAPKSPVAGKANTMIFPDLQSGNIGYKLVERLAKAKAYGPICQGMAKPANDLSRGCKAEDIVGVVAITCVQAQN